MSTAGDAIGDDNMDYQLKEPEIPKHPPIFIPAVDDVGKMVNGICKVIEKKD